MTKHSRKWKESQVTELRLLSDKYPVIAVASIKGFPGALAKEVRKKLHGRAVVKVSKTRVVGIALKQSKSNIKEVLGHVKGSVAVIFTDLNPFELYSFLKKNKVSMSAKAGIIAPDDIVVPAGDTGLPPGPALSDLKAVGLKTVMQGPTISIAEDKVIAKKGEAISSAVVGALTKLGIKPLKVGLGVIACVEKGQLFMASVLDIDVDQVRLKFSKAARDAINVAIEAAYASKDTASLLIGKAYKSAKAVAMEANIVCAATAADLIAKANAQATALKKMAEEKAPAESPKAEAPADAQANK